MSNSRIYLSPPHMGKRELELVKNAFETNWIAPIGPHVNSFEVELASYLGVTESVALSSGTAAVHLALILLGVERGDEVICQSLTFAGSCNPIVYLGATPIFVDSEMESWNMDPGLLAGVLSQRSRANRKPKAIIIVDLYGMPARLAEIRRIANEFEVPLIEDAAEAIGSTYDGKTAGTSGDFGVFSFNGNKIITTSGGGALIGRGEGVLKKARFLATQARDPASHYEHSEIGYNYRLSNVCAAIGRGQLEVLNARVARRREIFDYYQSRLMGMPGVSFQPEKTGSKSNRWLTTLLIERPGSGASLRETVRLALEAENIESRPLWKPMHLQPVFKDAPAFLNGVSERLFTSGLCLPSGSSLTEDQLDRIVAIVRRVLEK